MKIRYWNILCSVVVAFSALTGLDLSPTEAAEAFPVRPITWIVPHGAGGGFDVYARGVAAVLQKHLHKPVVIKNIPGAGSRTGANVLYRAKTDGYNIGILNVVGLVMSEMVMETQFDMSQFTYLGGCAEETYAILVRSSSPFRSIADLQKAGQTIKVGATGVGASDYAYSIIAYPTMNIPFHFVLYWSVPEAIVGFMRGDIDAMICMSSTIYPYVKSGDLRPIAVLTEEKSEFFPDVQTVVELGYPELAELTAPRLIAGPPNLQQDRAAILKEALLDTLKDPKLLDWAQKTNHPIVAMDSVKSEKKVKGIKTIFKKYQSELKQYWKQK